MTAPFLKVLFQRYAYNVGKILGKVAPFFLALCTLVTIPCITGQLILESSVLFWFSACMIAFNAIVYLYLIGDYVKEAYQSKTLNVVQMTAFQKVKATSSNQVKDSSSSFEKTMLYGGWVGALCFIPTFIVLSILDIIVRFSLLNLSQGFRNVLNMRQIMEVKNQKFLAEHPEKAAEYLKETLPKADKAPNKPRL